MKELELVLGIEVHMHLKLNSKMFCRCSADIYGKEPNTHTCPVCLGLPGALPVANKKAIEFTQLLGLALNCSLNKVSKFDRKNYFYPDLPKGYQISQYDIPLCYEGFLEVKDKKFGIERVHLEEDTGKSLHEGAETLLDFNKSGMALVEIVTRPDFRSADEVVNFCKMIQKIARTLKISDVDMEKGQMRLEANISLREKGSDHLPNYKVEVKNINSFRFLEKAVNYEIKRQTELLEKGEKMVQENRGFDDRKGITVSQREKEEANEYRYFPEPDIPPFEFTEAYIEDLKTQIPELPYQKIVRYISSYGISESAAEILVESPSLYEKFENLIGRLDPKTVANLLVNKLEFRDKSEKEIEEEVKKNQNKETLPNDELEKLIDAVIFENEKAVSDYKAGRTGSIMYLLGQVMKQSGGKIDAKGVKEKLEEKLK